MVDRSPSVESRRFSLGLLVLVVWYASVLFWAFRPVVDHVPTGLVDNQMTIKAVSCGSPQSSDAGTESPLPDPGDGREFQRPPCVSPHQQDRRLVGVDTGIAVVALGLLLRLRSSAPGSRPLQAQSA